MRKIVWSMYVSLDGVVENPMWTFKFWNDELAKFKHTELFESDALLLGRLTYAGFAEAWPTMTDEQGFADRINNLPKHVASRTMTEMAWNATPIQGDLVAEITKLKAQPGQNILIYGSTDLAKTLMEHNLIDEYRLMVYPIVLGEGTPLFKAGATKTLQLVDTQIFATGVVAHTYTPAPSEPAPSA